MIPAHERHAFFRQVAFGLPADQAEPDDPLAWAIAQVHVSQAPAIDILEKDGRVRTDLPSSVRLLWKTDEVMIHYQAHLDADRQSNEKGRGLPTAAFEALRKQMVQLPYGQTEPWKEVQARVTTALYGGSPVFERFWHFWTNHFMVAPGNQNNDTLVGPYQRALRQKMTGSFRDMLWQAVTDPGMLIYLDNNRNTGPHSKAARERRTRDSINENLGRELLELFTLSPAAGYTQQDVEATTLILTGWRDMKPIRGRVTGVPLGTWFDPDRHEPGSQTVLGKTYTAWFRPSSKLEDLITDLARHPQTARHLSHKLCVYFMDDEPPASAVAAVEKAFILSGGDLPTVHQAVIQACWDHRAFTRKFLSPEAWLIQTLTLTGIEPPRLSPLEDRPGLRTNSLLGDLGQGIPRCPQPNGWPIRSSEWISKEMLDRRARCLPVLHNLYRPSAQGDATGHLRLLVHRHLAPDSADHGALMRILDRGNTTLGFIVLMACPTLLWS